MMKLLSTSPASYRRGAVCDQCGTSLLNSCSDYILPNCRHRFCHPCLESLLPDGALSLVCPVCYDQYIVPWQGLSAFDMSSTSACTMCLKSSQLVDWQCVTCGHVSMCSSCKENHDTSNVNHVIIQIIQEVDVQKSSSALQSAGPCPLHPIQQLEFYCSNCALPLCEDCAETYQHSSHSVILYKAALLDFRFSIDRSLASLKEKIAQIQVKSDDLQESSSSLRAKRDETSDMICSCFDALNELLQKRKSSLVTKLKGETFEVQSRLQNQQKLMAAELATLTKECENAQELTSENTSLDQLRDLSDKLAHLVNQNVTQGVQSVPEDQWPVQFYPAYLKTMEDIINRLGVVAQASQLQTDVNVQGEGLRYCCIHKQTTITLYTKNGAGNLVHIDRENFYAEIFDKVGTHVTNIDVRDGDQTGEYNLRYKLQQKGAFLLSIKLYGKPIKGSPFSVHCISADQYKAEHCSIHSRSRSSGWQGSSKSGSSRRRRLGFIVPDDLLLKVGSKGYGAGQFTNPQGICCNTSGRIIVADSQNKSIQVFADQGDLVLHFASRGRQPGCMQRPTGVCCNKDGQIIVADYDNKWINVFDPSGNFINRFGASKLVGPKGVAVDNLGRIIVVDNKASAIYIYEQSGKLVHRFGTRGDKPHQLAGPHYVAVSQQNWLYITDFHHHCVKVYDVTGEYLFTFGSNGKGNGQFNAPTGIAMDSNQNVLVADWGNNRIQVFDSDGSFLSHVNSAADPIFGPQGLAATADGCVAVSDSGNHCYKVYRYLSS